VSLTRAGEIFLAEVTPALGKIRDASQRMLDAKAEPSGLVRLTSPPGSAELIGEILLEMVDRYPRVRIEVDFTDRMIDLVAEGFDLALRGGKLADTTLVARPVVQSQWGYYATPAYLKGRGLEHPDRLVDHQLIVYLSAHGPRWQFQIGKKLRDLPVHGRVVVNSLSVAQMATERGHGISCLPASFVRDQVRHGSLVPVLKKFWPPPFPVQLVYPSARHLAPQVRALVELLVTRLRTVL
jgi:DNA-binding transcriptional LysR family regulator